MNHYDVNKFIYENIKDPKELQMLNEIRTKYGYPYMVGAMTAPIQIKTLKDLYEKKPELIMINGDIFKDTPNLEQVISETDLNNTTLTAQKSFNYKQLFDNTEEERNYELKLGSYIDKQKYSLIIIKVSAENIDEETYPNLNYVNFKFSPDEVLPNNSETGWRLSKNNKKCYYGYESQNGIINILNFGIMATGTRGQSTATTKVDLYNANSMPWNLQTEYTYAFYITYKDNNKIEIAAAKYKESGQKYYKNEVTKNETLELDEIDAQEIFENSTLFLELISYQNTTLTNAKITLKLINLKKDPILEKTLKEEFMKNINI